MRRYGQSTLIKGGKGLSTNRLMSQIRTLRDRGELRYRTRTVKEGERIDHIAAQELGSSQLWWVLAAMSDIGWPMQLPPGTVINIPTNLNLIKTITGG